MNKAKKTTSMTKIKVLIVDDSPQVRQGLSTVLQLMADIEVVGEASHGLEAVQLARQLCPDIVVMDLEMPEMDGFAATRQIKRHHLARVVVLTLDSSRQARERAARMGVDAFVEKGAAVEILVEAIREVWCKEENYDNSNY